MIRVMKEYIKCELMLISSQDSEDVLASLLCLLGLADDVFFRNLKSKKSVKKLSDKDYHSDNE